MKNTGAREEIAREEGAGEAQERRAQEKRAQERMAQEKKAQEKRAQERSATYRPDQEDLFVVDLDAAVVSDVAVCDWHSHVPEDVRGALVVDELCQALPGEELRVALQEMVGAAIAGNLQLGSCAQRCAGTFGLDDRRQDSCPVAGEVQTPLVEATRAQSDQMHLFVFLPDVVLVCLCKTVESGYIVTLCSLVDEDMCSWKREDVSQGNGNSVEQLAQAL